MAKRTKSYGLNNPLQDVFPGPVVATRDPTTNDTNYELGQAWVNRSSNQVWHLSSVVAGSATWALSSPGASDVDTLTGDSGGALSPAAGNITLAGGTNITSVGSGSTITFNLDAAVTLATSVSSPIYTVAAATVMNIDAATGQNIIMKMGDNAAANKVSFTDSDDVEVFAIDSNGGLTFTSLTVTGAFTQTAGAVSISEDNSANAVGIANGTTARAVTLASSAAAHTVAIGSVTGAAQLDLKCGTGNFSLDGAAGTTYTIGAATTTGTYTLGGTAQTGTMTLGDSSGINIVQIGSGEGATTVNIAGGATAAKVVNIAVGAVANVVTIGSASGAAQLDLKCGTGNFSLDGAAGTTYTIGATTTTGTYTLGGTAQTGTMTLGDSSGTNIVQIGSGEGATTVNVAGGATNAKVVNIGVGAVANLVTIGSASGAAKLDLLCGTGNFTLEGATGSTYDFSATGVNTGTVTFAAGTGARIVNLATGGTGVKTVNLATGAIGNIVTIGTVTAAAKLDLLCGTGNFTLEGDVASTYDISSTGINTGTVTIASGTGARTLELAAGGTGIKTINIGTGATADVITIGTTDGAGSTTIVAGTGDIILTGTVKDISAEHIFSSGTNLTVTQSPIMQSALTTGAAPSGADGDVNLMYLQDGCLMEQFIIGTQTILAPRMSATGLDIELDNINAEGVEYNFGALSNAKHAYVVNTAAAFFFSATLTVEDLSGCSPLMVGFRKVEANNKVIADYTDYFCAGLNTGTSITEVVLLDELNGTGQTITNSTTVWTGGDTGTTTINVLVSAAGVCTYTIDGGAPAVTNAVTFDSGDVVMPFIHFLNGADVAGAVSLNAMSCGFQA